jgi:hypothetical protein
VFPGLHGGVLVPTSSLVRVVGSSHQFFEVAELPSLALGCASFCVLSTTGIRSCVSSRRAVMVLQRGLAMRETRQASSFDFRDVPSIVASI